jgi:NAD(P)-dependent dehydrogenase (short-subunit alcohol dehydrogenase family)
LARGTTLFDLTGKVAIVTGSTKGIGRAMVEGLAAAGASVVVSSRKQDLCDVVAEEVRASTGADVMARACHVGEWDTIPGFVGAVVAHFGRIDVLVNNAGYANVASIEDLPEDDFRAQVEANLFGVVNVTRAALSVLRAQKDGHIIQISSIGGRSGSPGLAAYQASKWAVGGFSEVLAIEVRPLGIRVTIVEPGGIRTDWAGSSMRVLESRPEYQGVLAPFSNMRGRPEVTLGDPAKMARVILRLADEKNPPLHLLLGSDAFFLANLVGERRHAEDARWKSVSVSTDFEGMDDFADTPMGKALAGMKG